jgi:hypothetical protein
MLLGPRGNGECFHRTLMKGSRCIQNRLGWSFGTSMYRVDILDSSTTQAKTGVWEIPSNVGLPEQIPLYSIKPFLLFYIYIYQMRLWCFAKHKTFHSSRPYLKLKSRNGRSKPLNMIFILKYL